MVYYRYNISKQSKQFEIRISAKSGYLRKPPSSGLPQKRFCGFGEV